MTDSAMTRMLRGLVAAGGAVFLTGAILLALRVGVTELATGNVAVALPLVLSFGALVWIAAPGQPRNRLLWVITLFVVTTCVTVPFGELVRAVVAPDLPLTLNTRDYVPADLPATVAIAEAWSVGISSVGFLSLLIFGFLLFPDGRLPSPRWRPVGLVCAFAVLAVGTVNVLAWLPANTVVPEENPLWLIPNQLILFGPLAGLISLVVRFHASDRDARDRIKWVMWGAAVALPVVAAGMHFALPLLTAFGMLMLIGAYGIAITRYRLFDVDLVISKTLVFAGLAVFIGVVYVGVVVGAGSLVGSADEPSAGLSAAATALVAVAFQPVRRRMERVANRLVYGRRATPYEVLSDFSRRVAATSDNLVADAARSLAEGSRAERVVISVIVEGEQVEAAAWPQSASDPSAEPVSFPITDGDAALGSLDVYPPSGQPLQEQDRRLAEQLAAGMGLALRNQLLTERLEVRVEELRESRRRLVALQDETRRRLERDLHDGAQQQLVALKVKLGLGRAIAEKDGATQTAELLARLSGEADQAVDGMREFARGVYPPLLEAEGLASAITAHARRAPIPVSVESDGIGRYPSDVEATVYFCVLEAVRNATQHAHSTQMTVTLVQANGALEFRVADDGAGFDPGSTRGVGLTTMADRLDSLAGSLTVHTESGSGTTVIGIIPIPIPAEAPA